jgi:thioredoxin reductase
MRGKKIAVYGRRQRGLQMARAMTAWGRDIVLCSDGPSRFSAEDRRQLDRNGIRVIETPVAELKGTRGKLHSVVFTDGTALRRDTLFFDTPSRGQSQLAASLGCRFGRNGGVVCGAYEATSVPGVFVAGNITRDVQLSIVAAAEGARAAFGINLTLTREDFAKRSA